MPRQDQTQSDYLEKASIKHGVPLEVLRKLLDIESNKQFMKRRHNISSSLRSVIIEAVRDSD